MEIERVAFTVDGYPAPKGSHIAVMRGERAHVVPVSSGALRAWEKAVVLFARQAMGRRELFDGPLRVYLLFSLPKPKSTREAYPAQRGRNDLDKYVRSTLDSLSEIIIRDDGLIVDLQARKRWAMGVEGLSHPGARIVVEKLQTLASMGVG